MGAFTCIGVFKKRVSMHMSWCRAMTNLWGILVHYCFPDNEGPVTFRLHTTRLPECMVPVNKWAIKHHAERHHYGISWLDLMEMFLGELSMLHHWKVRERWSCLSHLYRERSGTWSVKRFPTTVKFDRHLRSSVAAVCISVTIETLYFLMIYISFSFSIISFQNNT